MPATLAELKAACPGADADFLIRQLECGAEVTAAVTAHNAELQRELAAARSGNTISKPAGVTPPKLHGNSGNDVDAEDFNDVVTAYMTKHPNVSRQEAVIRMAKRHPEAYAAFMNDSQPNRFCQLQLERKRALESVA